MSKCVLSRVPPAPWELGLETELTGSRHVPAARGQRLTCLDSSRTLWVAGPPVTSFRPRHFIMRCRQNVALVYVNRPVENGLRDTSFCLKERVLLTTLGEDFLHSLPSTLQLFSLGKRVVTQAGGAQQPPASQVSGKEVSRLGSSA